MKHIPDDQTIFQNKTQAPLMEAFKTLNMKQNDNVEQPIKANKEVQHIRHCDQAAKQPVSYNLSKLWSESTLVDLIMNICQVPQLTCSPGWNRLLPLNS